MRENRPGNALKGEYFFKSGADSRIIAIFSAEQWKNEETINMAKIKFISADGNETEIAAENNVSLMIAAINNGIDGIVAECGGACSCATCHVIVDPEWYAKLPEPESMEKDMLEFVAEPSDTSRLSCQINVTDDLDGMVVKVPTAQY